MQPETNPPISQNLLAVVTIFTKRGSCQARARSSHEQTSTNSGVSLHAIASRLPASFDLSCSPRLEFPSGGHCELLWWHATINDNSPMSRSNPAVYAVSGFS